MRMIIRNLAICNYHDSSDDIRYHSSINNSTCINVMMINITTIKIIILRMLALIMIMTIMIMTIITWYWHVHPKWYWQWFSLSLYIHVIDWLHHCTYCNFTLRLWCSHLRHGCICSRFSTLPTSWSSFQLKAWDATLCLEFRALNFVWPASNWLYVRQEVPFGRQQVAPGQYCDELW